MTHEQIWRALDDLAAGMGLSSSGLARRAGLDPTSFNPSKRRTPGGRLRWPGTESLAKVLEAAGLDLAAFGRLLAGPPESPPGSASPGRLLPFCRFARLPQAGFTAASWPEGEGWERLRLPDAEDRQAYAVGLEDAAPPFQAGDILVLAPGAAVRGGDRVLLRTRDGEAMIKQVTHRSPRRIELRRLCGDVPARPLEAAEVAWMHKIVRVVMRGEGMDR